MEWPFINKSICSLGLEIMNQYLGDFPAKLTTCLCFPKDSWPDTTFWR